MAKSKPPKKKYVPKAIGTPMGMGMHNKLLMQPWVVVSKLSTDTADGEDAHTLLCVLNVCCRMLEQKGKKDIRFNLMQHGMEAMRQALDRDEDNPRTTDDELLAIRTSLCVADGVSQGCLTSQMRSAIAYVWDKVHKIEEPQNEQ